MAARDRPTTRRPRRHTPASGPGHDRGRWMADDPLALDRDAMRRMGYDVIDRLVDRIAGLADGPVMSTASREAMAARIDEPAPEKIGRASCRERVEGAGDGTG